MNDDDDEEMMSQEEIEARALGYEVIPASTCEVGLLKNGKGVRTWWCGDFNRQLPPLDHPLIQAAIKQHEAFLAEFFERSFHQIANQIHEESELPTGFIRTTQIAFIYDHARQYLNYPSPYVLCQKWVKPDPGTILWVRVPTISLNPPLK